MLYLSQDSHQEPYTVNNKLSKRKLSRFKQIFDESRNFSLLIDRCSAIDIIMEAKLQRFSQHFHKSYRTAKLFSHLIFVVYFSPA